MAKRQDALPAQVTAWVAASSAKTVTEARRALANLRDWAKQREKTSGMVEVLAAFERATGDKRPTLRAFASDALATIAAFARHRGTLEALWAQAKAAKLTHATKLLTPPSEQSTDTPEGRVLRALARGQGEALRKAVRGATPAEARALVGAIHGEANRKDVAAPALVAALRDAVAHEDEIVRFAAIDAVALASRRDCDLSPHVPALVAALAEDRKPGYAPGSGSWQTAGIAWSARRALGHAVRWPSSGKLAVAALRAVLDGRARAVPKAAAFAIAWGCGRRGAWDDVEVLLRSPKAHLRLGAVEGLVPQRYDADPVLVPSRLASRIAELRKDPELAIAKAAAQVKVVEGGGGPIDLRVLAEGLRSDRAADRHGAFELLKHHARDREGMAAITPWLVDGIGTEQRWAVLALLEQLAAPDPRWAPLLAGILLDGDYASASTRRSAVACLARIAGGDAPWQPLLPETR